MYTIFSIIKQKINEIVSPTIVIHNFYWEDIIRDEQRIKERNEKFDNKYPSVPSFFPKEWICPICIHNIEYQDQYKMLGCHHYFHEKCIKLWIVDRENNKCPMCKKSILL